MRHFQMYQGLTGAAETRQGRPVDDAADSVQWRQRVRKLLTPVADGLYMDVGLGDARLTTVRGGGDQEAFSTFADVRQAIAPGFGCDPDEIVATHSTTDGLCKIVGGLRLRPGDEIVTTSQEHHGGLATMALARDRFGVVIRTVALPVRADQRAETIVDRISRAITGRTRILLFSAPTFNTGAMLPIRALADVAGSRGVLTIVDGAHIPGMLAVKFRELGVDFLAASATKWQYGSPGTGLLYVRNKVLPEFNRRPLPEFWPVVSIWYPQAGGLPPRTATREPSYDIAEYLQAAGAASVNRMQALQEACLTWDALDRGRVEAHLLGISRYLKEKIAETWGLESLYSPLETRLHSAICTFNPFRYREQARDEERMKLFASRMRDRYGIVLRVVDINTEGNGLCHGLRIAVRIIHERNDIDRLIAAMNEACASGA